MKTISIFLALVNSLLAGLIITVSLSGNEIREAAAWWSITKTGAALCVIAVGILTWWGSIRSLKPNLIALSSLFLAALGAGTAVWTLHLALVTGDMEFYMLVYGGSLIMQGMASLFASSLEAENRIAS